MKDDVQPVDLEVQTSAIGVLQTNMARYRIWADRFGPHSEKVSRLLDELAEEKSLSLKKLIDVFIKKFPGKRITVDAAKIARSLEESELDNEHFFVVDSLMGKRILLAVLKAEYEAFVFFKQALLVQSDPEAYNLFEMLANFEEQNTEELREALEDYREEVEASALEALAVGQIPAQLAR